MKRKLLCIIVKIASAAAIAGTILFSLGRSEYTDISPVITLVIIFIATILAAAWAISGEPLKAEASGRERASLRAFRAVNILAILICVAFVAVMWFLTGYHPFFMRSVCPLMILATAGIAIAAIRLKEPPPIAGRDIAKTAVALVIAAALVFVYVNYMPKYSLEYGMSVVRSTEEFAQKHISYLEYNSLGPQGTDLRWESDPFVIQLFGGNPFYDEVFKYYCSTYRYDAGGLHILLNGCIYFNPATGAYQYERTEGKDKTYGPGVWPVFSSYLLYDKDGQHDAVLNLYFWGTGQTGTQQRLLASSGEWDVRISDVVYTGGFPEDEARAFLKSMEEEVLRERLLEQIEGMVPAVVLDKKEDNTFELIVVDTEDKPVEVYFFGINIATYQNGDVILKL